MDPVPLTSEQWDQSWAAVRWLWIAFAFSLVSGPALLTAHAVIPSAVETRTISEKWMGARIIFYLVGIVAFAGIGLSFFMAGTETEWIQATYNKFWH